MSNHIDTVRDALIATLADLRNKDNPMDITRAKAMAEVASVLVDSARVENDYLKITRQNYSQFLETPDRIVPTPHNPFPISAKRNLDDFEEPQNRLSKNN